MEINQPLRDRITTAICHALEPDPAVLAAWEGGGAAFGAVDGYSDIDVNVLVDVEASVDLLYAAAEASLEAVSPIVANHLVPPGRYYKLRDGGEFLLVDLSFFRAATDAHVLQVERHGPARPLFDKGDWLHPRPLDEAALAAKRDQRFRELRTWFVISQSFVRKAVLRGQDVEALACFWGYTLKPLADLLRIRYCPVRWDFGMRYLDRDLPAHVHDQFRDLAFVPDIAGIETNLPKASAWGAALLCELDPQAIRVRRGL